jgi:glycosyltransferase involved in cell wall biosynthesis
MAHSTPEVIAVIPVYNETASIGQLVDDVVVQADITIVVDDGSTDDTAASLATRPVTVVRHRTNRGKGAALQTGLQAAISYAPRWIATLDGDGQHTPSDLARVIAAARTNPDAVITGARADKAGTAPAARRIANGIADFFISWAARQRLTDTQSGLRVYPGPVIEGLIQSGGAKAVGFGWEAESLIELCRAGASVVAVPINAIYAHSASASHYRPARDSAVITAIVARKILARGLDPVGLVRALRG